MSTPEQLAWDGLRPVLLGLGLDPIRVENVVNPGHPDVDYTHGNIELKAMKDFPVRPSTKVRVPHFTGEQAGWLARRWQAGGLCWLMVRVGVAWYLFDGWNAFAVFHGLTKAEWDERAVLVYPGKWVGGRGWGNSAPGEGVHCYSKRLGNWLKMDCANMMPEEKARALLMQDCGGVLHAT